MTFGDAIAILGWIALVVLGLTFTVGAWAVGVVQMFQWIFT